MIGVVGLEGEAQQRRDRAERDVALVPVEPQAEHFLALEIALADDAAVDHRRGVGAGFRAGQSKAGNFAAVGQPRQPLLLLILGAEAHQQFAGPERVRHHHGDGGRQPSASRSCAPLPNARRARSRARHIPSGMIMPKNFLRLMKSQTSGGRSRHSQLIFQSSSIAQSSSTGPLRNACLLSGQRRRRVGQQLRPVGIAGEKVGVPPDIAGLQRLALGVRHGRQHAARPGEDRLGDEIAAEGKGVSWRCPHGRSRSPAQRPAFETGSI